MADAGNMEMPESQLLLLQENFEDFSLSDSNRDIKRVFFEIFRNIFVIFRGFFENFQKDIYAI